MVIGSTGSNAVNTAISQECTALGTLVNIVDQPELCSFHVPAIPKSLVECCGKANCGRISNCFRHSDNTINVFCNRLSLFFGIAGIEGSIMKFV